MAELGVSHLKVSVPIYSRLHLRGSWDAQYVWGKSFSSCLSFFISKIGTIIQDNQSVLPGLFSRYNVIPIMKYALEYEKWKGVSILVIFICYISKDPCHDDCL